MEFVIDGVCKTFALSKINLRNNLSTPHLALDGNMYQDGSLFESNCTAYGQHNTCHVAHVSTQKGGVEQNL
jgi:hypothetical protein